MSHHRSLCLNVIQLKPPRLQITFYFLSLEFLGNKYPQTAKAAR